MNTFFRSQTTDENQPAKRKSIMKIQNQLTNAIAPVRNELGRSPWRRLAFIIPLAIGLALVAVWSTAWAGNFVDCSQLCTDGMPGPDPDGMMAVGDQALWGWNAAPTNVTAVGYEALHDPNGVIDDTAIGSWTLSWVDMTGSYDTAVGSHALSNDTTGSYNTATGYQALVSNTDGGSNTA